jgi:hypothetical protein
VGESDLTPPEAAARVPSVQPPAEQDSFGILFSRLVRISGLVIALYEAFVENVDRPYILALAATMMSGSLFVDALIRKGKE